MSEEIVCNQCGRTIKASSMQDITNAMYRHQLTYHYDKVPGLAKRTIEKRSSKLFVEDK